MKQLLNALARIGLTLQVLKAAFAAGVSWEIALLLPNNSFPVFAPLAAILTTQVTIADSVEKALYRIFGVIIGVGVSGFVGYFFSLSTFSIIIVLLLGMAIATVFRLNPQIVSQVGVSALLVLNYGQGPGHGYLIDRIVETIIGSIVAVIINVIISPPDSTSAIRKLITQSTKRLSNVIKSLETTSPNDQSLANGLREARKIVQQTVKDNEILLQSIKSLQYTPFRHRERLAMKDLVLVMHRIEHITIQILCITSSVIDLNQLHKTHFNFARILPSTATCIELFGESIANPSLELTNSLSQALIETRGIQADFYRELQSSHIPPEIIRIFMDLGRILDEIDAKSPI